MVLCVVVLIAEATAVPRHRARRLQDVEGSSQDVEGSNQDVEGSSNDENKKNDKDIKPIKEGITKIKDTQKKSNDASENAKNSGKEKDDKADKRQYIPGYTQENDMTYPYNAGGMLMDTANFINEENTPVQILQIKDLTIKDGVIRKSNVIEGK